MKITEVVTRECCDKRRDLDLVVPPSNKYSMDGYYKCRHCGKVWTLERVPSGAGDFDNVWVESEIPKET